MKPHAPRIRWAPWLALLLCSGQAHAQVWDDFYTEKLYGEFGLGLELRDEQRGSGPSQLDQREAIPHARLTLGTVGYFYHPKLLEYNLRGTLQVEHQYVTIDGPQPDRSIESLLPSWDVRARAFKDHAYWGEVYSQRAETSTRQSFFPTIRSTVTETGMSVGAREWALPSTLRYHHYTFDSRGAATLDEVRDALSMNGGTSTGNNQFNYFAEYNAIQLKHRDQAYDDFHLRAASKHLFESNRDITWHNRATMRKQVGDLETDHTSAFTGLNSRFTENLDGDTRIEFDRFDSPTSESESLRWRGRLTHRLYESLISTGEFRADRTTVAGGDIQLSGLGGGLDYSRRTPVGRLGLRYGLNYYVQDQDDLQGVTPIFDESQVYVLGVPIILDNTAIDPVSVQITDATGLILYTEGLDYLLIDIGDRLQVSIPIGSLIVPGQTILISYSFRPSPAHSFSNFSQSMGFDFAYGKLADVEVGYQTNDQTLRSGTDPGNLTDSVTTTAAFQVHPLQTTLGVHFRRHESDFAPYERRALRFSVDKPIWKRSMWRLQAETYQTEFIGQPENEHGTSIQGLFTSSVWGTSVIDFRAEWFKVDFRADNGHGYSLELAWRRRIRDLEISVRMRYLEEQFLVATSREISSLFITLTRKF